MITPVKFELAKLIKDKGFVNVCEKVYRSDGLLYTPHMSGSNLKHSNILEDESYSAPTIAEVVMWLYEKHSIWISCNYYGGSRFPNMCFNYTISGKTKNGQPIYGQVYDSPTEVYEVAIEYCLTNLI